MKFYSLHFKNNDNTYAQANTLKNLKAAMKFDVKRGISNKTCIAFKFATLSLPYLFSHGMPVLSKIELKSRRRVIKTFCKYTFIDLRICKVFSTTDTRWILPDRY